MQHGACSEWCAKISVEEEVPLPPITRHAHDRRRSAGRRIIRDRRREVVPVPVERRSGVDRRSPVPRRSGEQRRVDE